MWGEIVYLLFLYFPDIASIALIFPLHIADIVVHIFWQFVSIFVLRILIFFFDFFIDPIIMKLQAV